MHRPPQSSAMMVGAAIIAAAAGLLRRRARNRRRRTPARELSLELSDLSAEAFEEVPETAEMSAAPDAETEPPVAGKEGLVAVTRAESFAVPPDIEGRVPEAEGCGGSAELRDCEGEEPFDATAEPEGYGGSAELRDSEREEPFDATAELGEHGVGLDLAPILTHSRSVLEEVPETAEPSAAPDTEGQLAVVGAEGLAVVAGAESLRVPPVLEGQVPEAEGYGGSAELRDSEREEPVDATAEPEEPGEGLDLTPLLTHSRSVLEEVPETAEPSAAPDTEGQLAVVGAKGLVVVAAGADSLAVPPDIEGGVPETEGHGVSAEPRDREEEGPFVVTAEPEEPAEGLDLTPVPTRARSRSRFVAMEGPSQAAPGLLGLLGA